MSFDRYTITYHLTNDGWTPAERGTPTEEVLETWEKDVYHGSGFNSESESWSRLSVNPNFTEQQVSAIRKQFPFPSKHPVTDEYLKRIVSDALGDRHLRRGK